MKIKSITLIAVGVLSALSGFTCYAQNKAEQQRALPFVQDFKPELYLGKWYEVARLPTVIQPDNSLATAEYSEGDKEGVVKVKNTAYSKDGKKLSDIQGAAKIAEGKPPGRLLVSFGPFIPKAPNYYVLHVDKEYQYAVVGVPDRRSLWILSRKAPIPAENFESLKKIAKEAGFDVSKLIVAPWSEVKQMP